MLGSVPPLGGAGWVHQVHDNTAARCDLSIFLASAWCLRSDLLPVVNRLFIPDPSRLAKNRCWRRATSSTWLESQGCSLQEGRRLLLQRRILGGHPGDVGDLRQAGLLQSRWPPLLHPFPSGLRCGQGWAPRPPTWCNPHTAPARPTARCCTHSMRVPPKSNLLLSFHRFLTRCCIQATARLPWKLLQDVTPCPVHLLSRRHDRYAVSRQWTVGRRPLRRAAQHPLLQWRI
jgi:hypothetical protein